MQLRGWTRQVSFAALVLLASACGEVKGGNNNPDGGGSNVDPNADFTLSVAPTSLTIPIAGSAKVTVTVTRDGTTGDIALSAGGLGSNLTADFSPAAIPEGSSTAEVTITVKGGTTAGMSTVSITGTAGDKTHSADVAVTSTTITVTGTVRGGRSGIKVGILGKGATTSGANGTFTFTDVTPPYDLYTFATGGCGNNNPPSVYFYDDLTRTDPQVTAAAHIASCIPIFPACLLPSPNANVSGTKSGTGNNTDPILWVWDQGSFNNPVLNTNGTFSGNADWCSGNTASGNLYALQLTRKTNGAPNTFLGYAKTQATYTSGSAATTNLTFATVTTNTITGTLNAPAGYPTPAIELNQQFGTTYRNLWMATTSAIDAGFPLIGGAGTALYANSVQNGVGQSLFVQPLTATATLDFTMPSESLSAPPNAATGVTTTTMFSWTASPGLISVVNVSAGGTSYNIYTTNNQLTIPVIPEAPLPSGASGSWSVSGFLPDVGASTAATVNEAAATNDLEYVNSNDFSGPAHAMAYSNSRTFMTQ